MIYNDSVGEVPKWLKGAVSKTARGCKSCRGSNPFFSAKATKNAMMNRAFILTYYSIGFMKKFPYAWISAVTVTNECSSTFLARLITLLTSLEEMTI